MPSFEFTDIPTSISLADGARNGKAVQTGSLSFTVRNTAARSLVGRLSVQTGSDQAPATWFAFDGAPPTNPSSRELEFEPSTTQTAKVTVNVPVGTPGGQHTFALRISAENDPDNDFKDSPAVAFVVPSPKATTTPPTNGTRFPWWLIAVAVAVVAVAGALAWYLLSRPGEAATVPTDIVGAKSDAAAAELIGMGFQVEFSFQSSSAAVGTVLSSNPPPGAAPPDGKTVKLAVSQGGGVDPCIRNPRLCYIVKKRTDLDVFREVLTPH